LGQPVWAKLLVPGWPGEADEGEILRLNDRILEYEEAGNAKQLKPLLAESFSILRSSGLRHDWEQFPAAVPENAKRGRKAEEPTIQTAGACVLYTCIVSTTQNPDGTPNPGRFWKARVFIQERGEWRCAAWGVMRMSETI
jgi:hypothetical protein